MKTSSNILNKLYEGENVGGMTIYDYIVNVCDGEIDMDVSDTEIDMMVALCYDVNDEYGDEYPEMRKFLTTLVKNTKIVKQIDGGYAPILICDFSSFFKPYNEQLKDFFDMDYSDFDADEAYYEAVANLEPLISGNASESQYRELNEILAGKQTINESESIFSNSIDYSYDEDNIYRINNLKPLHTYNVAKDLTINVYKTYRYHYPGKAFVAANTDKFGKWVPIYILPDKDGYFFDYEGHTVSCPDIFKEVDGQKHNSKDEYYLENAHELNESVDEDSEPYTVTGIAHVIDWYDSEGTIEMEPYDILEITPENICQGANDNGFGVKEITGVDAYVNGEEYSYSGDEFKKYSQGKEQRGIQIPKADLGEINNIEYYVLYTLDETYPVIKVNDKFLITRQGTNDFSGQWRLEGFIEANRYNYKWMISPTEALDISDWKYKNGNPKYTVIDYDHGSSRRWGGGGTGHRPYGFSLIDVDGFKRVIGNEDSIKIEDKTYTLKSSVNESANIDVNNLTKEQLWKLRQEIVLGSLYTHDYDNSFGIDPSAVCNFFDSFIEDAQMDDYGKPNNRKTEEYDNAEDLYNYYCSCENPFGEVEDINESEDVAIDKDPDLDNEQVNADVDYWTEIDEANTEDVSDKEPLGVYTVSNNNSILIYEIEYDIHDRVLAGDSSNRDTAMWKDIIYDADETYFWYGDIKVPLDEVMRTNI